MFGSVVKENKGRCSAARLDERQFGQKRRPCVRGGDKRSGHATHGGGDVVEKKRNTLPTELEHWVKMEKERKSGVAPPLT